MTSAVLAAPRRKDHTKALQTGIFRDDLVAGSSFLRRTLLADSRKGLRKHDGAVRPVFYRDRCASPALSAAASPQG